MGEFQAEGEKEEKEKRLLSLWEFKERKYDVSHTVSSSLYFSVRNCASGKIIKGRISLTIMLFVPYLSSTKEYHRPDTRCDLESGEKGRKVSLVTNILAVPYSQHEKEG